MNSESLSAERPRSCSPTTSAKDSRPNTMQIFIKTIAGETLPLNVPQTITVSELQSLLSAQSSLPKPLPTNIRLLHGGHHLATPSLPLSSYSVRPESTISLAMPPAKSGASKMPRCNFKKDTPDKCKAPIQRVVGDCDFCGGHFCSKHRLLESHNCEGLEDCKKECHERNADKLNSERTQAIKGI